MSFGLTATGDYAQVLFSAESNNLVFKGKPTFIRRSGYTNASLYFSGSYGTIYTQPLGGFYEYTFNSGGMDCIFFAHTPYPNKCSVAATRKTGETYSIVIVGQGGVTPQLYAFSASTNAAVSGHGLVVFKANSEVAFNSQDNILIVGGLYTGSIQYSNLQENRVGDTAYVGNGSNTGVKTIRYLSPINPNYPNISKPIVYVTAPQSALARSSYTNWAEFFELAGAFNASTKNMELEWINPAGFGSYSNLNAVQSSVRTGFFMVADGAMYD